MATSEERTLTSERAAGEVSYEELSRRLKDRTLAIVNVLPHEAFEDSRIPGSVSLPLADVEARAAEVLPDKRRETVVYCASDT